MDAIADARVADLVSDVDHVTADPLHEAAAEVLAAVVIAAPAAHGKKKLFSHSSSFSALDTLDQYTTVVKIGEDFALPLEWIYCYFYSFNIYFLAADRAHDPEIRHFTDFAVWWICAPK